MQNSDISGQRHLNANTRRNYQRQQRQADMLEEQRAFLQRRAEEVRQQCMAKQNASQPIAPGSKSSDATCDAVD